MEDLRESFGFEGDLPELGSPTSPTGKTPGGEFRRDSGVCVCVRACLCVALSFT